MKNLNPESYPTLTRLLAKEETKVVKNFRHEGRDYSIIVKEPGGLKKKTFVFLVDGEMFSNNGKGWASPDQTMQAIKQYVRDPSGEAVAALAPLR